MIQIDGSFGEGGGQILRSSLALSLITQQPFEIINIRSGRPKPGLMRQHLTAVNAAVDVGCAKVEGNAIGSQRLLFKPSGLYAGKFHFAIGTAGSTTLVLQTVLPALLLAEGESTISLEGGTHNPYAPPYEFLEKAYIPLINQMGSTIETKLLAPGFAPAGGGQLLVNVKPVKKLSGLELLDRGKITAKLATASVAQLPVEIAEKELKKVRDKLGWFGQELQVHEFDNSPGPGNVITFEIASELLTEIFTAFGQKNVSIPKVLYPVIDEIKEYLDQSVPVGPYLSDQLLLPLALAGEGVFRTVALTQHSLTNIEVIKKFLDVTIDVKHISKNIFEVKFSK